MGNTYIKNISVFQDMENDKADKLFNPLHQILIQTASVFLSENSLIGRKMGATWGNG